MANLNRIDLTQGKRFEKSLNQYNSVGIKSSTHRLRKGEIPHNLNITVDSTNTIITTNIGDISDWVSVATTTFTDSINYSIPSDTFVLSQNTIDNFVVSWTNNSTNTITNTWSMSDWYSMSPHKLQYNTNNSLDAPIYNRLSQDPFKDTEVSSSFDILYKLKHKVRDDSSQIKTSIRKRLHKDYERSIMSSSFFQMISDDFDSRYRLRNDKSLELETITTDAFHQIIDIDDSSIIQKMEKNLKKKAPFIKRIYVTNRGTSFDSTEFRFDMTLAQEHFNTAISKLCTY